jgi:hypothetical protein
MLPRLFPRVIDNSYQGSKVALWLLGLTIVLKATQSLAIIFDGRRTAVNADGIPIDTYPATAAQTILALFALLSLWRLLVCLAGVIVLVRYRGAAPLMLALFLLQYCANLLLLRFVPLASVGTPPGPTINMLIAALVLVGLILSLRRQAAAVGAT